MKFLRAVDFWLRIAAAAIVLVGALLFVAAAYAVTRDIMFVRRTFARALAFVAHIARLDVELIGTEVIDRTAPCVIVMNQQSLVCYAILVNLYLMFPDAIVVARMTEEWDLPIVRSLFRATGNINVDAANPIRSGVGIRQAVAALRRGTAIFIFPEGTRWKVPGQLGPFKRGAFRIAIEAQAPIIPVVVPPLRPVTDLAAWRLGAQRVEVRVLPGIPTAGMDLRDVTRLRDVTMEQMRGVVEEMARERGIEVPQRTPA